MRAKQRITVLSTLFILFNLLAVVSLDRAFGRTHGLNRQSSLEAIQQKPGADAGENILEPGRTIKRELAAGQRHIYRINLGADQFLRAIVEQDRIDVVVLLSGPDGKQITEFDSESRPRGQEPVTLVAEAAGEHRLTVQPRQKEAAAGGYEIRIEKLRPATDDDRALQEAHKLIEESLKLRRAGRFDQALSPVERALAIRQRVLGPEQPSVAHPLNNLAQLHQDKGDYAKAEPIFIRALDIREKMLGPEHPDVATTLNNLATLYLNKGAYAKAEPLYRRGLLIFEKALDPQHSKVAGNLNNLGVLYRNTGDYAKAEPFFQRAIFIWEKAVGPQQPEVALALNNLARLYDYKGDYLKAEPILQRALTIREKALGSDHPLVSVSGAGDAVDSNSGTFGLGMVPLGAEVSAALHRRVEVTSAHSFIPIVGLGRVFEADTAAKFSLSNHLNLSTGYRYLRLRTNEGPNFAELRLRGPVIGAGFRF